MTMGAMKGGGGRGPWAALLCLLLLLLAVTSRAAAIHGPLPWHRPDPPTRTPQPLAQSHTQPLAQTPAQTLTQPPEQTPNQTPEVRVEKQQLERTVKRKKYDAGVTRVRDGAPVTRVKEEALVERVQDEAPVKRVKDEVPVKRVKEEASVKRVKDEAPVKRVKDEVPVKRVKDEVPVKRVKDEAPVKRVKDEAPVKRVKDDAPVTRVKEEAPVKRVKDEAPVKRVKAEAPVTRVEDVLGFTPTRGRVWGRGRGRTVSADRQNPMRYWCSMKGGGHVVPGPEEVVERGLPLTLRHHLPPLALSLLHQAEGLTLEGVKEKANEAKAGSDAMGTEAYGVEAKGMEAEGVETKGTEAQGVDAKGAKAKGTEVQGTEVKGAEVKGAEAKGMEMKGAGGKEVEAKGRESRAVEVAALGLPEGCRYVERMDFKSVVCSGPNMTTVPSFPLARQVETLHFTNTGIQMVSDVSGLPRVLKALAFTAGNLAIFDGSKLNQLPELTVLTLDDNSISSWSFSTFLSSSSSSTSPVTIEYLSLIDNLITYPPDPSGGNTTVLPMLQTLVMNDNPMSNLPGKLFQPLAASPVTTLYLRNCSLSQFYGSPLEPLKGLRILDLSTNMGFSPTELTDLLAPLQDGNLTELYLANNNYGSVPTDALALVSGNLRGLDLHGSAFECLDNTSFPYMPRLRTLNLKYCRINSIQQDTFQGFPVLEELNLDGNGLVTIPTEVLLPSLKVLTLSENPRSTGSGSPESFTIDRVDFGSMTNLTNLTFQQVPLGSVEVTYFNDLRGLLELRLTACNIAYIQPFSFANLSLLQRLHLDQNELRVLSNHTFTGLVSLLYLDLSGNSIIFHSIIDFSVSARPQPALNQLQEDTAVTKHRNVKSKLEILLDLPQAVVRWLQGRELESVKDVLDNPEKEKKTQDMKYNVDKKREKEAEKKDDMDSNERLAMNAGRGQPHVYQPFKGLRSLRHLDISDNEVWTLAPELWDDLDQLVTLDLNSNDIQEWNEPVFTKLTNLNYLILSKNSLSLLTKAMVKDFSLPNLTTIDLRYNPFQCSCDIMSFNDTLNSSNFVEFSTYRCTRNKDVLHFYEYIDSSTCTVEEAIPSEMPTTNGMTVQIIIITISVLVSIIMTSVTVYKKRWYIRYLVHTARMRRMTYKYDPDHLYDIFICYSQADRQWVFEHLVAKLEDGGRYRVCVHERDFTVGQEITDNIISSVEKSRKVVMVLSPAFVESSWCMFELQLASNKILDERKNKLILILLTPLPSQNQPKKLRLLLKTRTYLPWVEEPEGQRLFWVRLMRTVAKLSVSEDPDASTYL